MNKKLLCVFCILAFCASVPAAANATVIRPYGKFGYLLTSPSASDLGYVEVGGGDLDQYLDVNKLNFGGGAQIFLGQNDSWIKGAGVRYGVDFGFQRLFTSKFQPYTGTSTSIHNEDENDIYLLGLVEFAPTGKPFFLQAGIGLDLVLWYWKYEHTGYTNEYEESSGTDTNFGFMIAAGMNLKISESTSLPVMVQINNISRYGLTSSATVVVGFDIKR
jgi:hypothetical protein